ncbi:hypothetical protein IQ06DRAFT_344290 [Phaeosphaeriaceae sp. SRC1lsM3a]|nr:hypothetical protein IQ06DRAFT_344290 [Stagonospora sp. SRC1lsM3a]
MTGLAVLAVALLAFFCQVNAALIPGPDSQHGHKSAVAHFELVDPGRKDPHAPTQDRRIMVSLFLPVKNDDCHSECEVSYMSSQAAKIANNQTLGNSNAGVFEQAKYKVCCGSSQSISASSIPVVVLEPHTDTSRLLYANLARYMTANNVAVVLIDHPHDSSLVEFSNAIDYNSGATGLSNFSPITVWNSTVTNAIDIRVQDIRMALDKLKDPSLLKSNFHAFHFDSGLDTSSYSIVGHGLGGTVATSLSVSDPRVRFSINLSGSAPPLDKTTSAPIYFIGRSDFRREDDINWPSAWQHLTGPATEFDLADSGILDFTDVTAVLEATKSSLKALGVGNSGAWGNHAIKCFVEGIIKDNLNNDDYSLGACVRMFQNRMFPFMIGPRQQNVIARTEESAGVSYRQDSWRAKIRHKLEIWGFL